MLLVAVLGTVVGLSGMALFALIVMQDVLKAIDKLRSWFRTRIASGNSDHFLTPILIVGGLCLTAIGVTGGLWLNAESLLGNVLANLVLIGPALVLSDLLVAYVRRSGSDKRAQEYAALTAMLLVPAIDAANDFLIVLGSEKRCANPTVINEADHRLDLHAVLSAIDRAVKLVEQASTEFAEKAGDDAPPWLPIREDTLSFRLPHFAAAASAVALLDREIACPTVLLYAKAAESFAGDCYVDFSWQGPGSPLRLPGEAPKRIVDPRIGFGAIRVWMIRAAKGKSATGVEIAIGLATYSDVVWESLTRSQSIIGQMIEDLPARLQSTPL